ncbi:hypothetical protein [Bartonella bovis]|uniref:hypothetical protein n=2 Tax=Bartonella bovis TaxID=155194 RepID=UPI001AEC1275|nr:hypothetical protein [Bartonella bovis]
MTLMTGKVNISGVDIGVEVKKGILAMKRGEIGFTGDYGISLSKSTAALIGGTVREME